MTPLNSGLDLFKTKGIGLDNKDELGVKTLNVQVIEEGLEFSLIFLEESKLLSIDPTTCSTILFSFMFLGIIVGWSQVKDHDFRRVI